MPHDLFDDAVAHTPSRSSPRRLLTILSVTLHASVIATVIIIQVFAAGPLPFPHRPLIFEEIRLVHLADIRPPSPQRRSNGSASAIVSRETAPIIEPRTIAAETPSEHMIGVATGPLESVEHGGTSGDPIGPFEGAAPPATPPSTAPQRPVRLHAGIQAPTKIAGASPIYPSLARAAHVTGIVVLEAVIDGQGNVTSLQIIRSVPLLDQAAVDAVRQWRYTPALLNGQPVPVVVTVTVTFSM